MLLRFIFDNFRSFNHENEFSMIAGPSRSHKDHVVQRSNRNDVGILKSAAIYGSNASGKSNFVKAISFSQKLIVKGVKAKKRLPIDSFALESASARPSTFQFELKLDQKIYTYGFSLTAEIILEEWLYLRNGEKDDELFFRKTKDDVADVTFKDLKITDKEDAQFLFFVAKGTRSNQLFLNESMQRNVKYFSRVFTWFSDGLTIIYPNSINSGIVFQMREEDVANDLNALISRFDVGMSSLRLKEVSLNDLSNEIPDRIIEKIREDLDVDSHAILSKDNKRYIFSLDKENLSNLSVVVSQLVSMHKIKGTNHEIPFEISQESDGTQRLLDLIPILRTIRLQNKTYIVDEIDRSLHPHISKQFIDLFFQESINSQSQFIFTTHESSLMDLDFFRRDEIWFVEKNNDGESHLYSLEEYKPRYDKDIRKGYLLGRFGAIPFVSGSILS